MTKSHWQKLGKKIIVWLFVEILLNFLGIDDLADYSEFIVISKESIQFNSSSCYWERAR